MDTLSTRPPPVQWNGQEIAPGTMIGEYRIEAKLGHGAMGVVYGAVHPVIGKRSAIKVMKPYMARSAEAIGRFVQEARAIAHIGHPHIVDAFSFGVLPDGRCYFMMEWLRGETLATRVRREPITLGDALEILLQVCLGLEAAHTLGVVHRDLKPDNVFLVDVHGGRPFVKILDFSVAKLRESEGEAGPALTKIGAVLGTPAYMSPEQARGLPVDDRSDIYSLGVLAYEVCVHRLPFWSEDRSILVELHLRSDARPPTAECPGLPQELDALILGMLAKDPAARPSLAEVRGVLEELAGRRPSAAVAAAAPAHRRATPAFVPPRPELDCTVIEPAPVEPDQAPPAAQPEEAAPPAGPERARVSRTRLGLIVAGGSLIGLVGAAALVGYLRPPAAPSMTSASAAEASAAAAPVAAPAPTRPATLVIRAGGEPNLRVEVDGRVVAEAVASARLDVDPGEHIVSVRPPGRPPVTRRVVAGEGATVDVELVIPQDPDPETETEALRPVAKDDVPRPRHDRRRHSTSSEPRPVEVKTSQPPSAGDLELNGMMDPYPERRR